MFARISVLAILGIGWLAPGGAGRVAAQDPQAELAKLQMHDVIGKVHAVAPGTIQVLSQANQPYIVQVAPKISKTTVTGTAKADFLRPGVFIRFTAELDKRGNAKGDLSDLAVFTPNEILQPGVLNDNPSSETGPFVVSGQITANRKGKVTIRAGKTMVKAKISDDAAIKLEVEDYSIAKQGDDISVKGRLLQMGSAGPPVQPTLIVGEEIKITLAEPASGVVIKKKRGKPGDTDLPKSNGPQF